MKLAVHLIVAALFVAMAWLQVNDPDPAYWLVVYLMIAAVPLQRALKRRSQALLYLTAGMVLAGALGSAPGFVDYLLSGDYASLTGDMRPDKMYVESAREFIGLVMGAVCLAAYWRRPA